jgi:hypothetical protein
MPALCFLDLSRNRINTDQNAHDMRPALVNTGDSASLATEFMNELEIHGRESGVRARRARGSGEGRAGRVCCAATVSDLF